MNETKKYSLSSRFQPQTFKILGVIITTSLEPGRKIDYNFSLGNHNYFTSSLEEAMIHIIAHKNGVESDFARAACKLLNVSRG